MIEFEDLKVGEKFRIYDTYDDEYWTYPYVKIEPFKLGMIYMDLAYEDHAGQIYFDHSNVFIDGPDLALEKIE